jgi:hypothetical protein
MYISSMMPDADYYPVYGTVVDYEARAEPDGRRANVNVTHSSDL